jgi:hypothetical protein
MAHNNFIFLKYKQLNLPELVYLGDDTTQDIVGEGNVYIFLSQGEISIVCRDVIKDEIGGKLPSDVRARPRLPRGRKKKKKKKIFFFWLCWAAW